MKLSSLVVVFVLHFGFESRTDNGNLILEQCRMCVWGGAVSNTQSVQQSKEQQLLVRLNY